MDTKSHYEAAIFWSSAATWLENASIKQTTDPH